MKKNMNLVRLYKLHLLGIEQDSYKEAFEWIDIWTTNLESVVFDPFPNLKYCFNCLGQIMFKVIYDKNINLFVRHEVFWEALHFKYRLDNNDIKALMIYIIKYKYCLSVDKCYNILSENFEHDEKYFKYYKNNPKIVIYEHNKGL